MSSVHKVLAEMQKTQPRRLMGNRVAMLVLGGIIIVGMILVMGELNKPRTSQTSSDQPEIKMAMATQAKDLPEDAIGITVSLNEEKEWVVAKHGIASLIEMRELFEMKSAEAEEAGLPSVLRVRIAGEESAKYLIELHRLAQQCGIDHVSVVTAAPST